MRAPAVVIFCPDTRDCFVFPRMAQPCGFQSLSIHMAICVLLGSVPQHIVVAPYSVNLACFKLFSGPRFYAGFRGTKIERIVRLHLFRQFFRLLRAQIGQNRPAGLYQSFPTGNAERSVKVSQPLVSIILWAFLSR